MLAPAARLPALRDAPEPRPSPLETAMVARNFGGAQGLSGYSQLLELEDDRDEYLPLEQLKPAHLQPHQHNVYYELTSPAMPE